MQVKNSILVSYLIDLTKLLQYQRQQSSSKSKSKPASASTKKQMKECIKRLNEMKVIIEKIKPLEKKMRYQIDKLLTISSASSSFALGGEDNEHNGSSSSSRNNRKTKNNATKEDDSDGDSEMEGEDDEKDDDNVVQMEESDPLSFRPNLAGFGSDEEEKSDDDNDDGESEDDDSNNDNNNLSSGDESDEEEDDEEILAAKAALQSGRKSSSNNSNSMNEIQNMGVYKAPRLAAVPFEEKQKQQMKEERQLKKQRDRMKRSELLSTLKATYGDMPEEDDFGGGATVGKQRDAARKLAEREAEKTKFEEDAFIRLTASRKEKKTRNRIMREEVSNLHSIADIGNLTAGVSLAFGGGRDNSGNDDEVIRVGGSSRQSSRHANGKRRRDGEGGEGGGGSSGRKGKRRNDAKNSFQKALFGIGNGSDSKKKKGRK